jgi:tetratricopeptide (TPR) repeat protein
MKRGSRDIGDVAIDARRPSPRLSLGSYETVLLVAVALFTLVLCLRRISAIDVWWQLATGRYVLRHGFPATDAFSFSVPDHPWIEMRWLYCTGLYLLWQAGGAAGAILVKTVAVFSALAIALAATVTRRTFAVGVSTALLAVLAMNNRLMVRPEIVSYVFVAFFLFAIQKDRERGTRWTLALPVLQLVWTNAHTLFALGPAILGAWFVSEAIRRFLSGPPGEGETDRLRRSGIVLGLSSVACLVNPWFLRGAVFPITLFAQLGGTAYSDYIGELFGPFHYLEGNIAVSCFLAVFALAILSALVGIARFDPFWTIVVAAFAWLSFSAVRNIPLFLIAAVPYVCLNLRGFLEAERHAQVRAWLRRGTVVLSAACVVLAWTVVTNRFTIWQKDSNLFGLGVNRYVDSSSAVDFLEENGIRREKAFCNLEMGSYLVWREFPVFFDPRLEVYGEAHLLRYQEAVTNDVAWAGVEAEYGFPVVFLFIEKEPEMQLAQRLHASDRWRLVYLDHSRAVLLREGFAPGVAEFDPVSNRDSWLRRWREALPEPLAREEAGWLRPLDPPVPYQRLGFVLGAFGFEETAEVFFRDAVTADPDLYFANYALGQYAFRRGDWEEAVLFLGRALRNVPRDAAASLREQERKIAINFYLARSRLNETRGNTDAATQDRERARALSGEKGIR